MVVNHEQTSLFLLIFSLATCVRDAGVAGSANEVTDGRSCCGSANSTSIGHHQRLSVGGTHRDRISQTLGGRSEEISQVCVVWGKAVALSRYHVSPTTDCFGKHSPSDKGGKFTFYLNLEAFPRTVGMNGDAVDQGAETAD